MVLAPRVRWFHRLPQAAAEAARQSTPLCSKKRLSSLSTSAWRNAGDTSASGTHWPRRTVASVRKRCSTSPSRERIRVSEGLKSARTSSNVGMAQAPEAQAASTRVVACVRMRKVGKEAKGRNTNTQK